MDASHLSTGTISNGKMVDNKKNPDSCLSYSPPSAVTPLPSNGKLLKPEISRGESSKHEECLENVKQQRFGNEFVLNPDGSLLLDHNNNPVSIAKILASKPLRSELLTRPGPGNKKLTYMSGESVTRTLNDVFGFDGWCLEIKSTAREECKKDEKGRFHVMYIAMVRVTHRRSGTFKEDVGAGDSIDKTLGIAIAHALKASITDAMKRCVRHFGEKLGNSLYQGNFSINKAPKSLKGEKKLLEDVVMISYVRQINYYNFLCFVDGKML
mmetsp:Transcript_9731/g.13757  ORF Transcript_9731/g.13757 Transcript_9731/m.13757 type:complete len:268 (+) Transcript_9731:122-925(+)